MFFGRTFLQKIIKGSTICGNLGKVNLLYHRHKGSSTVYLLLAYSNAN